ncbi:MAG TPA: exodeoxyribonuclease III [Spirochaetia bacterium]|nr:exodeoxyribonuclease III [Spirochaetia bacterium]
MKLISWNVNGIRAMHRKNGFSFLEEERPDILCLQEVRAGPDDVEGLLPSLPHQNWYPASRPGYSGTATFSRRKPLSVRRGIGVPQHDREGRVLTVELPGIFIVNVYTPNSRRDLSRLAYRRSWDRAFLRFLRRLESHKPVLFCGDINVAHEEIDLARPKQNHHTHGFTVQERAGFSAIIKAGFIDTFRALHPEGGNYTWWNLATGSRERNIGWRIDYVVISESLRSSLQEAFILPKVTGSDHCPVGVMLTQ